MNNVVMGLEGTAASAGVGEGLLSSPQPVVCLDDDLRVTYFNRGAEDLFAVAAAAVSGRPFEELLAPRSRADFRLALGEVLLHSPAAGAIGGDGRILGLRKGAETVGLRISVSRGECGWTLVPCEMSADDEVARTLRAEDELLSFVAHDLRNPLNVVRLSAQLLEERMPADDDFYRRWLAAIQRAVDHMETLVQDLLAAARTGHGASALHPRVVPAGLVVREAAMGHKEIAEQKGLRLELLPADPELRIEVDLDLLVRALSNLIGNAVKFTPPGSEVAVSVEQFGSEVRFVVRDTGPGIDEAHVAHVFDRFWQAPGSKRDGAGLGLAIVKGAVEAHGGRVWVESRVGEGSTFSIAIPVEHRGGLGDQQAGR